MSSICSSYLSNSSLIKYFNNVIHCFSAFLIVNIFEANLALSKLNKLAPKNTGPPSNKVVKTARALAPKATYMEPSIIVSATVTSVPMLSIKLSKSLVSPIPSKNFCTSISPLVLQRSHQFKCLCCSCALLIALKASSISGTKSISPASTFLFTV